MIDHKFFYWGPYTASFKIDKKFCTRLLKEGKSLSVSQDKRGLLAGQIEHEREFILKPWIKEGIAPFVESYLEGYRRFSNTDVANRIAGFVKKNWRFETIWINFQKANEFNPLHVHTGCSISFVIYLKVPPIIKKEASKNITKAGNPGTISFVYGEDQDFCTNTHNILPEENTLLIFPSLLRHEVMPFKSDVERISVAGNVEVTGWNLLNRIEKSS